MAQGVAEGGFGENLATKPTTGTHAHKGERIVHRKRIVGALIAGSLLFGSVACDDSSPENTQQVDEDDQNTGPGDGTDETGPGR